MRVQCKTVIVRSWRTARARSPDLVMRWRRLSLAVRPHTLRCVRYTHHCYCNHPSAETSPLTTNEIPFGGSTTPLSKSAHSHACPPTKRTDKKMKQKTIPRNSEWVTERDKYISAAYSSIVRSATKNTDAIFTAYVIENWRSRRCVRERRERRPRLPKRRRNI